MLPQALAARFGFGWSARLREAGAGRRGLPNSQLPLSDRGEGRGRERRGGGREGGGEGGREGGREG